MDANEPKAKPPVIEGGWSPDDADADEIALTRAVLKALRGWMLDGQTVVITRDDRTREVRIDAFETARPTPRSPRGGCDPREREDAPDTGCKRRCRGPGPSIAVARSGRRLREARR